MPKAYETMRDAMKKQYGKKEGTMIAAKTWNKQHKGMGDTVGNGRGDMMDEKEPKDKKEEKE